MSKPRILTVDLAATSRNWSLTPDGRARILDAAPAGWTVRFVEAPTVSDGDGGTPPSREAVEAIREAEVYFGFGLARPLFTEGRRLRWVHSAAAGVGAVLFPEMLESDVVLTNSAGIHAEPIAQHVVGGVLYLLRSFDVAVDLHRAGRWDKQPFVGDDSTVRELGDCRVLVVGAGGLGGAIGRGLAHFGAECVAVRRRPTLGVPDGFVRVVGPDAIDGELPAADVVVLATPATPETRGLLDRRRLDLLPRSGIVVNVGRGNLLDEDALIAALEGERLRGAVLDVFSEEPLAPDSRLWQLRQVLLTPHVSAVSPARFWGRQLDLFIDNWSRWVAGQPLRNSVDKRAGY
jgi:phosphoglycerate dehydrogenase-like enzyme